MVVYNVTIKLNNEIEEDWLNWMRTIHIPDVLNTGFFTKCRLTKLDLVENDGCTYAIQYDCYSMDKLNKYMIHFAPELQKHHIERYANKFVAFRTILNVVEEIYPKVAHS